MSFQTIRLGFLVSLVTCVMLIVPPAEAGVRTSREGCLKSLVQVIVQTRFGTTRRCSGYLYSGQGVVATDYHAISDAVAIQVFSADLGVYDVKKVRRIDTRFNIAILQFGDKPNMQLDYARLGDSRPLTIGTPLHVMSHSIGQEAVEYDSEITNLTYSPHLDDSYFARNYAAEMLLIEFDHPSDAGTAGGFVCNENYEVVGLTVGRGPQTATGYKTYALCSTYLSSLFNTTFDVSWSSLATNNKSDAEFFDQYFGPSPQKLDFGAGMLEGYVAWFAPVHHVAFADDVFSQEINDKIDKTWFYTSDLMVDGRMLREWSAWRIFIWHATANPWDLTDTPTRYIHFDADSLFSRRIYKNRDIEERIMTRDILAMPLAPGSHTIQYTNLGANYKSTGVKRKRIEAESARIELIDITGLSVVSMQLLPEPVMNVGEGKPVRYELERHPVQDKELNFGIRTSRYPVTFE